MLIIRPFNLVWFSLILLMALIIIGLTFLLKNKSEKTKKIVLVSIASFNIVLWFLYKYWLFRYGVAKVPGSDYTYEFIWQQELPLHLCNISLFLVVIGIVFNKKFLKAYCVFIAPLGAFLAIVAPAMGFHGGSLLSRAYIGFYGTHAIIIIVGMLLVTLGFYRPNIKDVPGIIVLLFVLAFIMQIFNSIMTYGFKIPCNYFYTIHPEGIGILMLFRKWIPCQLFYIVPGLIFLVAYIIILILPFLIVDNKREKKQVEE